VIEILLSEKITFYMLLLVILSLLLSAELHFEIFFIMTYLSLLFLREMTANFNSKKIKMRMNLFIVAELILVAWIIYLRVIEIISLA
jgi:hypothetical protein